MFFYLVFGQHNVMSMNCDSKEKHICMLLNHGMIHWFIIFYFEIHFMLSLSCSLVFLDVYSIYYVPRRLASVFIYYILTTSRSPL